MTEEEYDLQLLRLIHEADNQEKAIQIAIKCIQDYIQGADHDTR